MPRGGARSGAGRPRAIVGPEMAALIRRDYEQRAHGYRLRQDEKRFDRKLAKLAKGGIHWNEDGAGNPLEMVPLEYRRFVVEYGHKQPQARLPGQLPTEHRVVVVDWRGVEKQVRLPAEIPEEVRFAIEFMRHNAEVREKTKAKLYSGRGPPRLYGRRQEIIKELATDYGLSRRTVRTICESGEVAKQTATFDFWRNQV